MVLVGPSCTVSADPNHGSPAVTGVPPGGDATTDDGSGSTSEADGASSSGAIADDDGTTTGVADATSEGDTTGAMPSGGVVCSASPTDLPCTACTKTNCCTQLEACWTDTDCSCFMQCAATNPDVFACGAQCGVDLFAPGLAGDVVSCSATSCGGSCP